MVFFQEQVSELQGGDFPDARGCMLTLGYDALNRLTSKASSGAGSGEQVSTTYTYDTGANGIGRRKGMTDASGSTDWTYDSRGRLTAETKTIAGEPFTTQWAYNSADLPVTMTYLEGEAVRAIGRGNSARSLPRRATQWSAVV